MGLRFWGPVLSTVVRGQLQAQGPVCRVEAGAASEPQKTLRLPVPRPLPPGICGEAALVISPRRGVRPHCVLPSPCPYGAPGLSELSAWRQAAWPWRALDVAVRPTGTAH